MAYQKMVETKKMDGKGQKAPEKAPTLLVAKAQKSKQAKDRLQGKGKGKKVYEALQKDKK